MSMRYRNLIWMIIIAGSLLLIVACDASGSNQNTAKPVTAEVFPNAEPSPSVTPYVQPTIPAASALDPLRPPDPSITALEITPDGSLWYAFDVFDSVGGTPPGNANNGLYRLKEGQITHHDVPGPIRVLKTAPDGSLLVGAGCGIWRFHDERIETLMEIACDRATPAPKLRPLDIALGNDGLIWAGSAFDLASYDGESWHEYDVPAIRIAVDSDGSIWTIGWDGRAGSQCCLSHINGDQVSTYSWTTDFPVSAGVLATLFEPSRK
jgi:hypothetical protein